MKVSDRIFLLYKLTFYYERKRDESVKKIVHVSLTHFLKQCFVSRPNLIRSILKMCFVAPFVGELPKELRTRKNKEQLSNCTRIFVKTLDDSLAENFFTLLYSKYDCFYKLDDIKELFCADCFLEIKGCNSKNYWRGGFGFVGKNYLFLN